MISSGGTSRPASFQCALRIQTPGPLSMSNCLRLGMFTRERTRMQQPRSSIGLSERRKMKVSFRKTNNKMIRQKTELKRNTKKCQYQPKDSATKQTTSHRTIQTYSIPQIPQKTNASSRTGKIQLQQCRQLAERLVARSLLVVVLFGTIHPVV